MVAYINKYFEAKLLISLIVEIPKLVIFSDLGKGIFLWIWWFKKKKLWQSWFFRLHCFIL